MPTATPETLVEVVRAVLVQAQRHAAGEVEHILDQIEDDAEAGWAALKKLVTDRPDWSTLLLLMLTKIRDLDKDNITVGTMSHPQWKRLLTLTYHKGGVVDASVMLGLGLTEPDAAHGILLKFTGTVEMDLVDAGGFHVQLSSEGDEATWEIPFGAAIGLPDKQAVVDLKASWTPPNLNLGDSFKVGPLFLHAQVDTTAPGYRTTLGLGVKGHEGVEAHLSTGDKLGFLGEIVDIAPMDAVYSPNVMLASGQPPSFSLTLRDDEKGV